MAWWDRVLPAEELLSASRRLAELDLREGADSDDVLAAWERLRDGALVDMTRT